MACLVRAALQPSWSAWYSLQRSKSARCLLVCSGLRPLGALLFAAVCVRSVSPSRQTCATFAPALKEKATAARCSGLDPLVAADLTRSQIKRLSRNGGARICDFHAPISAICGSSVVGWSSRRVFGLPALRWLLSRRRAVSGLPRLMRNSHSRRFSIPAGWSGRTG